MQQRSIPRAPTPHALRSTYANTFAGSIRKLFGIGDDESKMSLLHSTRAHTELECSSESGSLTYSQEEQETQSESKKTRPTRFDKLEQRLSSLENEVTRVVSNCRSQYNRAKNEINRIDRDIGSLEHKITDMKSSDDKTRMIISNEVYGCLNSHTKSINRLERELSNNSHTMRSAIDKALSDKLHTVFREIDDRFEPMVSQQTVTNMAITGITATTDKLNKRCDELERKILSNEMVADLREQLAAKDRTIMELQRQLNRQASDIEVLKKFMHDTHKRFHYE